MLVFYVNTDHLLALPRENVKNADTWVPFLLSIPVVIPKSPDQEMTVLQEIVMHLSFDNTSIEKHWQWLYYFINIWI